ncbi:osmoprotectant transport system ATP-binding protein [Luteibacter rhizovicinus]|uniref:Osmoprotectant transport system ATP-binding protein n=1 Tax=Luteibacter rhizovicinus TaxID=242606 RepID=A0A4R3YQC6_9GAMM|nr:ABC transporter ATP-binding protein [Luteibacter rhizovicinus]TCV93818.1 osmoprotectant transport system ATP-binding protein [Luteibacter rhizovicinus]
MIELDHVTRRYGETAVIDDLSLRIEGGELFVLVGPSGSGKSTLLRTINRLISIDDGAIRIDGRDVREVPVASLRRGIGYAIQSVGLFPHRTVAENIATVPRLLGWPAARIRARVDELIAMLQLDGENVLDRYPHALSGGQQQRVGVARALAAEPAIMLMDEPFGALDPLTRDALQSSIQAIHAQTGTTIVFVTHDMDEALRLGERIGLMESGRLLQVGTPLELLRDPACERVRAFVGGENPGLRELSVRRVRSVLRDGEASSAPAVDADATLQQALATMLEHGSDVLRVRDAKGTTLGVLHLTDLLARKP